MKMIHRFFVYLFLTVTVLILSYGYVYWGDLFGENTPIGYLVGSSSRDENVPVLKEEVTGEEVIKDESSQTGTAEDVPKVVIEGVAIEPVEDAVLAESPPSSNEIAVSGVEKVTIKSESSAEPSISDLWKKARHAFHNRDLRASVESYQQLIARTQDNFDALEELADVYAYYGKKKEAVAAYYKAATILVRLGKIERAASFMVPLTLMDTAKARALLSMIESSAK